MPSYSSLSTEELVQRCADQDDSAAWEEFVRRFHRLIAKVVLRVAYRFQNTAPETIDDLIQEIYLKLFAGKCRILRNFDHRHPDAFVGFVQVVAANVARDHFRSSARTLHPTIDEAVESTVSSGAKGYGSASAMEREVLLKQIEQRIDSCTDEPHKDRNRRIFWLYFRAGLSSAAIASLPGMELTSKGVESVILRMTREIRIRYQQTGVRQVSHRDRVEGNRSAGSL